MTSADVPRRRSDSSTSIALGTVVSASATPYGYTVTTWSSGALLMHYHETPTPGDVFGFAAGALLGFALVGLLAHTVLGADASPRAEPHRTVAGVLHWFAVGIALAAVVAVAQFDGWLAWPLGSFAATTLYLIGASLQLAFVFSRSR